MPPRLLSPIAKRILLVFLLGSSLLLVATSSAWLLLDYNEEVASHRQRLDAVMRMLSLPAARALWNDDRQQLQAAIDPAIGFGGVTKIDVLDQHGQVAASSNRSPALAADDMLAQSLFRPGQGPAVGTLRLYISYAPIRAELARLAMQLLLVDFLGIAILAGLLLYMLHRNVIAHLLAMAAAVEQREPHGKARQWVDLRRRSSHEADELDQLAEAINRFHREIADQRATRLQDEQQSQRLDGELARMQRVAMVQSLTTLIAHELNQPLRAMLGNAATIESSMPGQLAADHPLRDVLVDMASQARRAADIIGNLRNLVERRHLDLMPLALNTLLHQVVGLAHGDARGGPVQIHLQLAEQLPPVLGSALQLQQVVLSLIANAREAIAAAGIAEGHIALVTRQDDPLWLRVAVIDNGPGIPSELLEHVCSALFTTREGATGMGLWISRMIIEQHGGELRVENRADGGACVSFSLPVQQP